MKNFRFEVQYRCCDPKRNNRWSFWEVWNQTSYTMDEAKVELSCAKLFHDSLSRRKEIKFEYRIVKVVNEVVYSE